MIVDLCPSGINNAYLKYIIAHRLYLVVHHALAIALLSTVNVLILDVHNHITRWQGVHLLRGSGDGTLALDDWVVLHSPAISTSSRGHGDV